MPLLEAVTGYSTPCSHTPIIVCRNCYRDMLTTCQQHAAEVNRSVLVSFPAAHNMSHAQPGMKMPDPIAVLFAFTRSSPQQNT